MAGGALIGALRVTVGANSAEFERGMDRVSKRVKDTSKGFAGISEQAARTGKAMTAVFAGIGVAAAAGAARSFLSLADESKNLNAQLTLATAKLGTFSQAQADVARIANQTRESLTATASLYGNFIRATAQMGGTQEQAARATETFGKALKIGGADANAAASATLQFGQALASGALRGDEFNSIAEASPRILSLLADAMGVSQGSVRALAAEGKLTSDVLFKALTDRKFTAGIDAEFDQLPVTFDQAMTLVHNAAVTTFGAFDQGGQFSTMLADFMGRGTDGFAGLSRSAEQFGQDTRSVMAGLGNVFDPLQTGGFAVFDALGIKIRSVSDQIYSLLQSFDRVGAAAAGMANALNAPGNLARRLSGQPTTTVYAPNNAGEFRSGMKLSAAQLRRDASARRLEGLGYIVPRNKDGSINEAGIKRVERVAPIPSTPKPKPGSGGGRSKAAGGGRSAKASDSQLQSLVDGLLPDEAQARELQQKSAALGKALAAGLLPRDVYDKATAAISEQVSDLYEKTRAKVDLGSADLKVAVATSADPVISASVAEAVANAQKSFAGTEIGDAVEDSGMSALRGLNTDLTDAIMNAGNLGEAFSQMGRRIVASLLDIAIQQAVIKPLAASLFGGSDGGGGLAGSVTSLLASTFGGGRAKGGPVDPSSWYVVGEKGPELFAPGVGGTVIPNAGRGSRPSGGGVAHIIPSKYFDVVVDGRVARGSVPIAMAAVSEGLGVAQKSQARTARQTLG